jgi:hypothetical protein
MSKYYNLVLFVLFAGLVGCLSDSTADSQEPLKVETVDGLLRINVLQDDIIRVSFMRRGLLPQYRFIGMTSGSSYRLARGLDPFLGCSSPESFRLC